MSNVLGSGKVKVSAPNKSTVFKLDPENALGSSQVGFIARCPINITVNQINKAKHQIRLINSIIEQEEAGEDLDIDAANAVLAFYERQQADTYDDLRVEPDNTLDYLFSSPLNWTSRLTRFRDVYWIADWDSEDRIIVFAGTETWGDTPDGAGYQFFETVYRYGLSDILGIDL